jgi:predicted alpha-1,2-mannosidase
MRQTGLTGKPAGSEFGGRNGLEDYIEYGYLPSDKAGKSVSATLEYAWADHALSLLARELGKEEDAAVFTKHAQAWHNLWDPARQYFVPRDSQGKFADEVNPYVLSYIDSRGKYTKHYVEGSGMQWRWGVPFDMEGLVGVFKSRDYFIEELERYFKKARRGKGTWNPGPYYWQGNEPYFHAAYLFNAAGRPDLTQKWVRWAIDTKYGDDYVGLDGNDDGGTLSAWYVWSALGLYPIAGTPRYELGAPLFEEAEVRIGKATLKIVAANHGPENMHVRAVALNDMPLDRTWIGHDEIGEGGVLEFEMSATPE